MFAGRCPGRWQQCWWGRGRSRCRPVRRPPRAVPWGRGTRPGPLVRATPTSRSPATAGTTSSTTTSTSPTRRRRPPRRRSSASSSGVATIDLVATQDLDRFNLDLRGMDVQAITVNGKPASEVAPPAAGRRGRGRGVLAGPGRRGPHVGADDPAPTRRSSRDRRRRSSSTYGGATTRPEDIEGALYGWVTTRDGAMVVGEPEGSMTWYPVSDHQTDKATYSFEITVPEGKVAVANGLPARRPGHRRTGGRPGTGTPPIRRPATSPRPRSVTTTCASSDDGRRAADHRRRRRRPDARQRGHHRRQPRAAGGDDRLPRGAVRAVPVQLRSARSSTTTPSATRSRRRPGPSTRGSLARAPSPTSSPTSGSATPSARSGGTDIWLNEGWATYVEWLWSEDTGRRHGPGELRRRHGDPGRRPVLGAWPSPTRARSACSSAPIYDRGAATLHALRVKVGDEAFFAATQEWLHALRRRDRHHRGLPGGLRGGLRPGPRRRSSTCGCARRASPRPGDASALAEPSAATTMSTMSALTTSHRRA